MKNVRVLWEIVVDESISGDKFATGSRVSVLTAHTQTLSSQKSPKIVCAWRRSRDKNHLSIIGFKNNGT